MQTRTIKQTLLTCVTDLIHNCTSQNVSQRCVHCAAMVVVQLARTSEQYLAQVLVAHVARVRSVRLTRALVGSTSAASVILLHASTALPENN